MAIVAKASPQTCSHPIIILLSVPHNLFNKRQNVLLIGEFVVSSSLSMVTVALVLLGQELTGKSLRNKYMDFAALCLERMVFTIRCASQRRYDLFQAGKGVEKAPQEWHAACHCCFVVGVSAE